MILCFLIEPARGSSAMMWEEYYAEDRIDTIFVGSSLCSATFDPKVINEGVGVASFNMGTPMQVLKQNITAVENAIKEHEIKTVVVGMGFFSLQEESVAEAELTFAKALAREKKGLDEVIACLEYAFSEEVRDSEKSINFWFPWLYNYEDYAWETIYKNILSKIRIFKEGKIISDLKGYRPYEGVATEEQIWEENSYYNNDQILRAELITEFEKLLYLCTESGADVIVINTPHPAQDVVTCYEVYAENDSIIRKLCEKYDVDYYDFSLIKQDVFDSKLEYYYNYEHLNYEGSQVFSHVFCSFMQQREKGEDMNKYFYSVEEYMQLHKGLLEEWKTKQVRK